MILNETFKWLTHWQLWRCRSSSASLTNDPYIQHILPFNVSKKGSFIAVFRHVFQLSTTLDRIRLQFTWSDKMSWNYDRILNANEHRKIKNEDTYFAHSLFSPAKTTLSSQVWGNTQRNHSFCIVAMHFAFVCNNYYVCLYSQVAVTLQTSAVWQVLCVPY